MKPHRLDGVSLTFGLFFLLIAIWWAVSQVVTLHLPALGWTVAGGLILFGVVGLLGAISSGRRDQSVAPVAEPVRVPATPGDLPPEVHASIVQELLEDPGARFQKEHPGTERQPEK
ncbi:phage holin family protein [Actinoplanes oblitus]|uniref:Phage holin family protein n=1 Tax=Actinoplanes oblitus TaxID=3040509 RepID=A0ABY8WK17_9ACTN|nr:phage holin family protein [Actinoplanes oblitus]WIM97212.1 phage holin family protein [Actinoplanes oblitus]